MHISPQYLSVIKALKGTLICIAMAFQHFSEGLIHTLCLTAVILKTDRDDPLII